METLCVTGHRPDGLPWKKQRDNSGRRGDYLKELESILILCIENGYNHFISGGAIGVDTDFAFTVLNLRKKYPITLEIAVPCPDQSKFWTQSEKRDYEELLSRADKVTICSDRYTSYCMQKRNVYMVDNSDCVLCCYNGSKDGGTYNTIKYAEKSNKKMLLIDLSEGADNHPRTSLIYYYNLP